MSETVFPFQAWLAEVAQKTERNLDAFLPPADTVPAVLHEGMRYAVMDGGKRIRAALVYAAAEAVWQKHHGDEPFSPEAEKVVGLTACAIECMHAYSLVHDDMPCMDNDELRRGKPTVHKKYGEAIALLVGDALQTEAFETFSHWAALGVSAEHIVKAVETLAKASGSRGMAGGQAIDLLNVGQSINLSELRQMHALKTGALIMASVRLGGLAVGASDEDLEALQGFAEPLGLAYQVVDDILDVVQTTDQLGKTAGKDQANDKPTYVQHMGLSGAQTYAASLYQQAISAHPNPCFTALAQFILHRQR